MSVGGYVVLVFVTNHSGQLSLLLPVGREMSTDQVVLAVLCGSEQGNKGELDTACIQFGSGGGANPPPPPETNSLHVIVQVIDAANCTFCFANIYSFFSRSLFDLRLLIHLLNVKSHFCKQHRKRSFSARNG